MTVQTDVTAILEQVNAGSREAADRLLPRVYDELRRLAQSRMSGERPDHTLQATALVHEAYLKLVDQTRVEWRSRVHFFAVAAQAIRRILVDHARHRGREKRGGNARISLDDAPEIAAVEGSLDHLALHQALTRLAASDPEKEKVVELRFFGGLTSAETAEALGLPLRTVERHWQFSRAWLYRELSQTPPPADPPAGPP